MPAAQGAPLSDHAALPASSPATVPGPPGDPRADPIASRASRGPLRAVVAALRPRQWIKNALVIAAAGAAGALGHDDVPVRVVIACAAFCLLASGIYCLNDVRDAAEDRLHPRKRFRPVAAGELSPRAAVVLGVALIVGGLSACAAVAPLLAIVGLGYLVITLTYTLIWRRILFLDVAAIASGFVLRAVAGGVAAPVRLSIWFVLVVTFAAVFLAAGKRHAERVRSDAAGLARRRVLERYSVGRLRLLLGTSGVAAVVAYWFWAFGVPTIHGIPWRPLTAIPFTLVFLRYAEVVRRGGGEAPEEVILHDRGLTGFATGWLILFVLSVHAAS